MTAPIYPLREALTALRRRPVYTLTLMLTLALTLGALIAVFALSHTLLWKPLPWPETDRLVHLYGHFQVGDLKAAGVPRRVQHDWRAEPQLETLARVHVAQRPVQWPGGLREGVMLGVDGEFFALLGARARIGRLFAGGDAAAAGGVVISAAVWQREFAASQAVIGQSLEVDGQRFAIVGVLDETVQVPEFLSRQPELFLLLPGANEPDGSRAAPYHSFYFDPGVHALARVKPGVSLTALTSALQAYWQRGALAERGSVEALRAVFQAEVRPIRQALIGNADRVAMLLLAGVSLLVLISLASLASLVLARSAASAAEFALREALGLSPAGLRRHVLIEMLLLMALTTLLALWVALWALELIRAVGAEHLPLLDWVRLDGNSLLFALAAALLLAALLTLLALAGLRQSAVGNETGAKPGRASLRARLQGSGKGSAGAGLKRPLRQALLGGQLALVALLVLGAMTLVGQSWREIHRDRGFDPDGLAVVVTSIAGMPGPRSSDEAFVERWWREFSALQDSLLPRVAATLAAETGPGTGDGAGTATGTVSGPAAVQVQPAPLGTSIDLAPLSTSAGRDLGMVETLEIGDGFFALTGLRLLAGQHWPEGRQAAGGDAVLINEPLAAALGGAEAAIGQQLLLAGKPRRVLGVVAAITATADARAQVLLPLLADAPSRAVTSSYLLRAGRQLPDRDTLQQRLQAIDARLQVDEVYALDAQLRQQLANVYLAAALAGALALLGIVLALAGVFGAAAWQARLRRPEFGLRLALGAWPQRLLREQIADALPAIAGGLVLATGLIGWGAPLLQVRGLALPALQAGDALLAGGVLAAVAMLAVLVAVAREIRRSPWQSLRND